MGAGVSAGASGWETKLLAPFETNGALSPVDHHFHRLRSIPAARSHSRPVLLLGSSHSATLAASTGPPDTPRPQSGSLPRGGGESPTGASIITTERASGTAVAPTTSTTLPMHCRCFSRPQTCRGDLTCITLLAPHIFVRGEGILLNDLHKSPTSRDHLHAPPSRPFLPSSSRCASPPYRFSLKKGHGPACSQASG